eukprot:3264031-Prymnesium_polylepis.1
MITWPHDDPGAPRRSPRATAATAAPRGRDTRARSCRPAWKKPPTPPPRRRVKTAAVKTAAVSPLHRRRRRLSALGRWVGGWPPGWGLRRRRWRGALRSVGAWR